jgi:hypothetical protein
MHHLCTFKLITISAHPLCLECLQAMDAAMRPAAAAGDHAATACAVYLPRTADSVSLLDTNPMSGTLSVQEATISAGRLQLISCNRLVLPRPVLLRAQRLRYCSLHTYAKRGYNCSLFFAYPFSTSGRCGFNRPQPPNQRIFHQGRLIFSRGRKINLSIQNAPSTQPQDQMADS